MEIPAVLRQRARDVAQWSGWRRFGPAAGSAAFHLVAAGLIALSLGSALSEEPPRERKREKPIALDFVLLELDEPEPEIIPEVRPAPLRLRQELPPLELPEQPPEPPPPEPDPPQAEPPPPPAPMPEPEPPRPEPQKPEPPKPEPQAAPTPPPQEPPPPEPPPQPQAGVTPPPRVAPAPEPPTPEPPRPEPPKPAPAVEEPRKDKAADTAAPKPILPAPAPGTAPAEDEGGVYIPPSILVEPKGGPAGLRNLAYGDPCESRFGKKPKECVDDWRARVGTMDSLLPRSQVELDQHFAEFMTPCPNKVGCEGGEWISTNGTRAPLDNTSPASGGAASLGGIHDLVGRLPQKPDFVDPGFGD